MIVIKCELRLKVKDSCSLIKKYKIFVSLLVFFNCYGVYELCRNKTIDEMVLYFSSTGNCYS